MRVAEKVVANRHELEEAVGQYWTGQVPEVMVNFLSQHGVDVESSWQETQIREAVWSFIKGLADQELLQLVADCDAQSAVDPARRESPLRGSGDDAGTPVITTGNSDGVDLQFLEPDCILVKRNPRKNFDAAKLEELAASIRRHGLIQPLLVNLIEGHYELVAGERRLRAAKQIGLPVVKCHVITVSRDEASQLQLLENLHRADLTPLEEAEACAELILRHRLTHESLAEKLGKSPAWVRERLTLRELPELIQEAVDGGELAIKSALSLRPYLQGPGKPVPEAVVEVAALMVDERPPGTESARWVEQRLWQESRTLEEQTSGNLDYELRYNHRPRARLFPLNVAVEGITDLPLCVNCLMRYGARSYNDTTVMRCLQPSCWERKQGTVWERMRAERQQADAEQEEAKRSRLIQQAEQAVTRQFKDQAQPPVPAAQLAGAAVSLHELAGTSTWHMDPEQKEKHLAAVEAQAQGVGFSSLAELETGLGGGHNRLSPGALKPQALAGRMAELVLRKHAGEDITQPLSSAVKSQRQGKVSTAPAIEGADPERAAALRRLAADHWPYDREEHRTDVSEYEREAYLPIASLLEHWRGQAALGASSMPAQIGEMTICVPEFSVWIRGHESGAEAAGIRTEGDHLVVSCRGGHIIVTRPVGLVYYRLRVDGSTAHRILRQQLVLPVPEANPPYHVVVTGAGGAVVRKTLLPKWLALLNRLPAVPDMA